MTTYKDVLNYYNFLTFPRAIGNPFQKIANTYEEFIHFIHVNNGVAPVFTGHNSYYEDKIVYDQMLIDMDFKRVGYEEARREAKELFNEFEEYRKKITFSGHGYQFYLEFEQFIEHNELIAVKEFQQKLKMESIDPDSAKASQLCRIPQTLNIKQSPYLYCIPIGYSDLSLPLGDLQRKSKRREMNFVDNTGKIKYPNDGMIRHNVTIYVQNKQFETGYDWLNMQKQDFINIIQDILDDGFYELIMEPKPPYTHPSHKHLFDVVTKIKTIGYPMIEAKMILDKLTEISNWDKPFKENQKERHNQIEQIYRGSYVYKRV